VLFHAVRSRFIFIEQDLFQLVNVLKSGYPARHENPISSGFRRLRSAICPKGSNRSLSTGSSRRFGLVSNSSKNGQLLFVNEFLKNLYAENCLTFNVDRRNWQWSIEQIRAMNITDNVVVLMTNKLSKLPESVQQVLQLAACVGNEFDLDTLSMICEKPVRQIFSDLAIAVQAKLNPNESAMEPSFPS
jgi:hypothetical protein